MSLSLIDVWPILFCEPGLSESGNFPEFKDLSEFLISVKPESALFKVNSEEDPVTHLKKFGICVSTTDGPCSVEVADSAEAFPFCEGSRKLTDWQISFFAQDVSIEKIQYSWTSTAKFNKGETGIALIRYGWTRPLHRPSYRSYQAIDLWLKFILKHFPHLDPNDPLRGYSEKYKQYKPQQLQEAISEINERIAQLQTMKKNLTSKSKENPHAKKK